MKIIVLKKANKKEMQKFIKNFKLANKKNGVIVVNQEIEVFEIIKGEKYKIIKEIKKIKVKK